MRSLIMDSLPSVQGSTGAIRTAQVHRLRLRLLRPQGQGDQRPPREGRQRQFGVRVRLLLPHLRDLVPLLSDGTNKESTF